MKASIQFLNHASVRIANAQTAMTADPWLEGPAFNDGWDLLSEQPGVGELIAPDDWLWFSHEHPDHFSIDFVRSLTKGRRILFQRTPNGRVARFLRERGHEVHEVRPGHPLALAPGVSVSVWPDGLYDSWSHFRDGETSILNLNDCELSAPGPLRAAARRVGPVDVLLTQFSYAGWKGGRDKRDMRLAAAANKLASMRAQIAAFKPTYVIPFASFARYSHAENDYLNDGANSVATAVRAIEDAGATAIVMKPGDLWRVGEPWDNEPALAHWTAAAVALPGLPLRRSQTVPAETLIEAAAAYAAGVRRDNGAAFMRLAQATPGVAAFQPLTIEVRDLGQHFRFSMFEGLAPISAGAGQADVSLSSDSLKFLFRNVFGYDTLLVNGRFEAGPPGFARMTKNFAIGSLNARGLYLGPAALLQADVLMLMLRRMLAFLRRL